MTDLQEEVEATHHKQRRGRVPKLAYGDRGLFRIVGFTAAGTLLLLSGLLLSNSSIETALVSDPSKSLGWGPTLFRALLVLHGLALVLSGFVWRARPRSRGEAERVLSEAKANPLGEPSRVSLIILVVLNVLSLGLRLWKLDLGLWHDEVLTLLDFVRQPLGEIVTSFPSQNQHMLYSILAHFSTAAFGESAWAMRLPSVLFGVASLWALFLLGRRMLGAREALLACALMTVSYHHIWFSQNARGYMGLMFFSLIATWLWLEASSQTAWRWWVCYAIAVSLGMWTNITMAFIVASHGVVYLLSLSKLKTGYRWKPLVAYLLCVSMTLQLYALSLPEFLRTGLHEESLDSVWTNPMWIVAEMLRNLQIGFAGIAVVLCGAAMVGIGWLSLLYRDYRTGILMVLPALFAGSTMIALRHNLWPRFFFFSMGFALLITVHGAMRVPQLVFDRIKPLRHRKRLAIGVGVALASLMIVASSLTVPRCYALPKQDFVGARDYVEHNRRPGEAVVTVGLAAMDYERYYAPHWFVAKTQSELDTIRNTQESVWLIYTLPIQIKAWHPEIWLAIEKGFEVVKVFPGSLGGGEVYVCQQRTRAQVSLRQVDAGTASREPILKGGLPEVQSPTPDKIHHGPRY